MFLRRTGWPSLDSRAVRQSSVHMNEHGTEVETIDVRPKLKQEICAQSRNDRWATRVETTNIRQKSKEGGEDDKLEQRYQERREVSDLSRKGKWFNWRTKTALNRKREDSCRLNTQNGEVCETNLYAEGCLNSIWTNHSNETGSKSRICTSTVNDR